MNIVAAPYEVGPSTAISEIYSLFSWGATEWEYCLGFEGETWDALMVVKLMEEIIFAEREALPGLK